MKQRKYRTKKSDISRKFSFLSVFLRKKVKWILFFQDKYETFAVGID